MCGYIGLAKEFFCSYVHCIFIALLFPFKLVICFRRKLTFNLPEDSEAWFSCQFFEGGVLMLTLSYEVYLHPPSF